MGVVLKVAMAVPLGRMDTVLNMAVVVVAPLEMVVLVAMAVVLYSVLLVVEGEEATLDKTEDTVGNGVLMAQGVEVLEAMVQQLHQMRKREILEDLVVETVAGVEVQPLTIITLMVEQEEMVVLQAVEVEEVEPLGLKLAVMAVLEDEGK